MFLKDYLGTIGSPQDLWLNFYELTQIPRPSGHEEKVRFFVLAFGKNLGLESFVDDVGNVVIKKPATPGMENRKTIILQTHLDMVPEKNNDIVHDFKKDPITAVVDGEWICAQGTTLGADNGIGIAAALTVLESDYLIHGPLEVLFTVDEETGLTGASGLKPGILNGDILLNLDSEEEGEVCIGCAGGKNVTAKFIYKNDPVEVNTSAFIITVTGLHGGHSAGDINSGFGNAIKILSRFYKWLEKHGIGFRISFIDGGTLRNAIPRDATSVIVIPTEQKVQLFELSSTFFDIVKSEFSVTEPKLNFTISDFQLPNSVMTISSQEKIVNAIYGCPNGVDRMSDTMPGLPETSSNLAMVKPGTEENTIVVTCLTRSSVNSLKDDFAERIGSVFILADAKVEYSGDYPGWKPNPNSEILNIVRKLYEKIFGKLLTVTATHGGLECGVLGAVYPNWDMLSFGPTIRFPHSPDEKVEIASVSKFWLLLINILEKVPTK